MPLVLIVSVILLQTSVIRSEEVLDDDVRMPVERKTRSIDENWHNTYHNLDEIVEKLKEMNRTYDNADLFSLGKSHEGRQMYAIKISSQYGLMSTVTEMLDKMDVVILPVMNVDGYYYSRKHSSNSFARNWPKNRNILCIRGRCFRQGVDLDRNFGYAWGYINPSHPETQEPKSNIYRGNHAFSEPETRNVRGYLQSLGGKLKGFLDFQDRGRRQWQMPWRYTFTSSPDHDIQKKAGLEAAKAIYKVGYRHAYQSCCQASFRDGGPAGGGSVDWVYDQLGVKYSYAVSMQDRSGRGERFVYVGKGLLEGVKAFVKAMQL
ncbi:unnamed protein product [Porites lobata]|uniref:Peptidase M14 domain-containing protein n=1 Tax=Porites lobata TaxID=104759 RepID=A0ABN8R2W9_9CNID|nr:unnamed protein product [Porites lobata]